MSKIDEMTDIWEDIFEKGGIDEHVKQILIKHDKIVTYYALSEVYRLTNLMELGDYRTMEFRKPTEKGKIQLEASHATLRRVRRALDKVMNELSDDICEMEEEDGK